MNLDATNVVGIKSFHDQCCIYHRLTLGSLTACSEAVCGPGGNSETFRVRNLDTYQDHASRLSEAV